MESSEIRSRFLKFFETRGHKIIPSSSLVPENDPSVLFNTAGMQPLAPYLLGQPHPMGKRIANIQKCVRTGDLDDVGDNRHLSFFEMMGNWSLGDYFKEEAIKWSYEFLTSKEEGLGLNSNYLYITVFEGDENAPKDVESAKIWQNLGIPEHRIYFLGAEDNWWAAGDNGPCGPDSEMFYDVTGAIGDLKKEQFIEAVKKEDVIEIWNDVFMEYEKKDGKVIGKLKQRNVDTGAGLDRMTAVMQGKKTAYDTDIFKDIFVKIDSFLEANNNKAKGVDIERAKRIIADHIRTSVFMIADGVVSSNTGRGYVLRRLIRRATRFADMINFGSEKDVFLSFLIKPVIEKYSNIYPELISKEVEIRYEIINEESKFRKTLKKGGVIVLKKYFNKMIGGVDPDNLPSGMVIRDNILRINGKELFDLYQTYGLPIEIAQEIMKEWGVSFDEQTIKEAKEALKEHQKLSQTSSVGMFKGGLANHNEKTIKLHTAHHLLLAGLQAVVDKNIKQKGSNITEERLRMDFLCDHKLTDEEKKKVEDFVNDKIKAGFDVIRREMPLKEAEKIGAEMEFGAKYPETVSVYFIEDKNGNQISKEFCGGPHVKNTSELGHLKIQKEEAVSAGIRRIKAILK